MFSRIYIDNNRRTRTHDPRKKRKGAKIDDKPDKESFSRFSGTRRDLPFDAGTWPVMRVDWLYIYVDSSPTHTHTRHERKLNRLNSFDRAEKMITLLFPMRRGGGGRGVTLEKWPRLLMRHCLRRTVQLSFLPHDGWCAGNGEGAQNIIAT